MTPRLKKIFKPDNYKVWHGKYWMLQYSHRVFFSLGLHMDFQLKYIDLHLICFVLTIGDMEAEYDQYQAWWSSRENS